VGVILAELFTLRPLFPGTSEVDELYKLTSVLGTPTITSSMSTINQSKSKDVSNRQLITAGGPWKEGLKMAEAIGIQLPQMASVPLNELIKNAPAEALSIMADTMKWDPAQRPSAEECLSYPWFKELTSTLRNSKKRMDSVPLFIDSPSSPLFNLTAEKSPKDPISSLSVMNSNTIESTSTISMSSRQVVKEQDAIVPSLTKEFEYLDNSHPIYPFPLTTEIISSSSIPVTKGDTKRDAEGKVLIQDSHKYQSTPLLLNSSAINSAVSKAVIAASNRELNHNTGNELLNPNFKYKEGATKTRSAVQIDGLIRDLDAASYPNPALESNLQKPHINGMYVSNGLPENHAFHKAFTHKYGPAPNNNYMSKKVYDPRVTWDKSGPMEFNKMDNDNNNTPLGPLLKGHSGIDTSTFLFGPAAVKETKLPFLSSESIREPTTHSSYDKQLLNSITINSTSLTLPIKHKSKGLPCWLEDFNDGYDSTNLNSFHNILFGQKDS